MSHYSMSENILFACLGNDEKRQMTEFFFRQITSKQFNVLSVGSFLSQFNLFVINVMKKLGIDMTEQIMKSLSNCMTENSSKIVSVRYMNEESYPTLFVKDSSDWNICDLKEKYAEAKLVQNKTKFKVLNSVKSVEVSAR